MSFMKKFDLIIIPACVGLSLIQYAFYFLDLLIHVDRPGRLLFRKPVNDQRTWAARLLILSGIGFATTFGYYAFTILDEYHLARVKPMEYYVIVVPILMNIGCVLGGVMQWKMELRIAKKEAIKIENARIHLEDGTMDEKASLIDPN